MSAPDRGAPCQKWTICSVPGGRFALLSVCSPPVITCCATVGLSFFFFLPSVLTKKKCASVCVIFASCPRRCYSGCCLCRAAAGMNLTLLAVIAEHIPLRLIVSPHRGDGRLAPLRTSFPVNSRRSPRVRGRRARKGASTAPL